MNLYFLVEGKTERKVYPQWISHLVPALTRVDFPSGAIDNNYYLISGGGFPSILDNHLIDSISDVNESGKYEYLVIVIDTDSITAEEKVREVNEYISTNNIATNGFELVIIPQVVCMESWFLGNKKIYSRNSSNIETASFANYYNVAINDPEAMPKPYDFDGTIGDYHYQYLKNMLAERNIRYSKSHPKEVGKRYYLDELRERVVKHPDNLKSMGYLFNFLADIECSA
jgi:hypothetical protein